jgi:hypothetical protein
MWGPIHDAADKVFAGENNNDPLDVPPSAFFDLHLRPASMFVPSCQIYRRDWSAERRS